MRNNAEDALIDGFVRAVGPRIAHITAEENRPAILAHGILPARTLALAAGLDESAIALRRERLHAGRARLNHQRPIVDAIPAAYRMLDDHTPQSWAELLDRRTFFWPEKTGERFARSIARDLPTATLWLDTRGFARMLLDQIDLSPINSGNFRQGGARARRGDWIFVPLSKGLDAFRTNRVKRGLVRKPDRVREISLRGGIPGDTIRSLLR